MPSFKGIHIFFFIFVQISFIYLQIGKGGRKKERERNINVWLLLVHPLPGTWSTTQARALTGNPTRDPLVLRPALNPLCHTSQGRKFIFLIVLPFSGLFLA